MFENVSEAVDFDIQYETLVAPVLDAIRSLIEGKGVPLLVGVCGRSRAGKTVAAHAIVRALSEQGEAALHVRLDHWIVPALERAANSLAEARNRVDALPEVVRALRAGATVRAPGYDAATRGSGEAVTYDPSGRSVIVLDGTFAGHQAIRAMLDFLVFADVPLELQQRRFAAFYRWKKLDENAIEALWRERAADEWPIVDAQRGNADMVLAPADMVLAPGASRP
jgi:uridine kinase